MHEIEREADHEASLQALRAYLDRPISELKGVGPSREAALGAQGIVCFRDVLLLLPRCYRVRPESGPIAGLVAGTTGAARGRVRRASPSGWGRRKNLRVHMIEATDVDDRGTDRPAAGGPAAENPTVELMLFGRAYLKRSFEPGRVVLFQGKVTEGRTGLQILAPDYHFEDEPGVGFPGIVPVYSLPKEIFPRHFQGWIAQVLAGLPAGVDWRLEAHRGVPAAAGGGALERFLPARGLLGLTESLRRVHAPATLEEAEQARRRLAYEEFFALQLGLARGRARRSTPTGSTVRLPATLDRDFTSALPFTLTEAQQRAVSEIRRDLASRRPMHRLLQGDVGSGKTVVALYPLWAAALAGGQAALMAPTEVLARQHHQVLSRLLAESGIEPVFLQAGLSSAALQQVLNDRSATIFIGTHALIQNRVLFRDLRVCVVDEQHKFGVRQRWNLALKGRQPHVLIMTATPIPRTLALTLYGELDISLLDALPPGRQPVETCTAPSLDDPEMLAWIEQELAAGGRVFVVCPLVQESDHLDLEAAVQVWRRLSALFGKRCTVELLHGRQDGATKYAALEAFRSGRAPLLVTTVVVEVGVDVPQASTVVITDAWRFGLSQLHQIRGRVGRGARTSRCYLLGSPATEAGERRIEILLGEQSGFRIAEEDLKMRGPGELCGMRQHGLPPLRAGDYLADLDLMIAAREDAHRWVEGGCGCCPALFDGERDFKAWIG